MINKAIFNSTLPKTMKLGFIRLICKNQNGRESLKNWRPISLLCTDYKIVSKVLANRLKSVLENLIDLDQTCSVPGRTILDNCHLLRNLVDYAIQKETELRIINFDLEKAFEKISHQYLISVLKNFGFGQHFIKMISLLYKDVSSSVIVNRHISNSFPYQRGVRRGCCLSPLLFVLCIEPLAIKIRSDNSIRGISLPITGELLKISQYADDMSAYLTDDDSIQIFLILFDLFGLASGSTLNFATFHTLFAIKSNVYF